MVSLPSAIAPPCSEASRISVMVSPPKGTVVRASASAGSRLQDRTESNLSEERWFKKESGWNELPLLDRGFLAQERNFVEHGGRTCTQCRGLVRDSAATAKG